MGDYGYITLMPQAGELRTTPEARRLAFSHSDEAARPDYYAVSLRTGEGTRIRAARLAGEAIVLATFDQQLWQAAKRTGLTAWPDKLPRATSEPEEPPAREEDTQ